MKLKSILFLLLLLCFTFSVTAQNGQRRGRVDVEAFIKQKSEYLKKELNLTENEAKLFLPLEAEFSKKKYEANRDARREVRELKRKKDKTDADFKRITKLELETEQRRSQLQIEYYKKFSEILPAEKIVKYTAVDMKYKEEALKRHREKNHSGENFD